MSQNHRHSGVSLYIDTSRLGMRTHRRQAPSPPSSTSSSCSHFVWSTKTPSTSNTCSTCSEWRMSRLDAYLLTLQTPPRPSPLRLDKEKLFAVENALASSPDVLGLFHRRAELISPSPLGAGIEDGWCFARMEGREDAAPFPYSPGRESVSVEPEAWSGMLSRMERGLAVGQGGKREFAGNEANDDDDDDELPLIALQAASHLPVASLSDLVEQSDIVASAETLSTKPSASLLIPSPPPVSPRRILARSASSSASSRKPTDSPTPSTTTHR